MDKKKNSYVLAFSLILVLLLAISCSESDSTGPAINLVAPTNFEVNQLNVHTFELSWQDSCDCEEGFKIERKIDNGSWNLIEVTSENETSYIDDLNTKDNWQVVYYKLYAYYKSSTSEVVEASTDIIFPAPSNLHISYYEDDFLELSWEDNSNGEEGFRIERKIADSFQFLSNVDENITIYTDEDVEDSITYSYRVCAYSSENNSDYSNEISGSLIGEFPDVSEEDWMEDFDQFIFFYPDDGIGIISFVEPQTSIFKLNNIEIELDWQYEYYEWWCFIYEDELPEGVDLNSGSSISYYFKINGKTYSGTIKIPYCPEVDWPGFDFDENFTFTWELEKSPNVQLVWMYLEGYDYKDDWEEKYWKLTGSKRTHTIPKSYYQDYEEYDEFWFYVDLDCVNYKNFGKCFVMSVTWVWYEYPEWKVKSPHKNLSRRERMFRILKGLDLK